MSQLTRELPPLAIPAYLTNGNQGNLEAVLQAMLTHLPTMKVLLPGTLLIPQHFDQRVRKHLGGFGCTTVTDYANRWRDYEAADPRDDTARLSASWTFSILFHADEEARKNKGMLRPECLTCSAMKRQHSGCIQFEAATGSRTLQRKLPTLQK